ncbi:TFC3 [[Candida] subhashii]|uniref:TFC3 n=1 Tax=[Candida] subhashii TaxID=561895 RepID=A0A8J5UWP1_9ASCO|nr:TFC3 [[Candida] subhashii]KAG7661759.1 TFC3 [[Candida] subhashii]
MSFSCTPYELVSHVLEKLSFSGQSGVTLVDLWGLIQLKINSNDLDDFQKQTIWQWLFFCTEEDEELQLYITKQGSKQPVTIIPIYKDFIAKEGNEDILRVLPIDEVQCYYLTGVADSEKFKRSLGDMPYQLLCEIAKYGEAGILSPELCKATGQDARSLPTRFKKLESLGLIVKKSVFHGISKQRTNLSVHSKFAAHAGTTTTESCIDSSFASANKLKRYIVQATKEAPNQIRSFRDLKLEVKMDKKGPKSKFFGTIVDSLQSMGCIERVNVKGQDDKPLYSLRYLKDLPNDLSDVAGYVEVFNSIEEKEQKQQQEDVDEDISTTTPETIPTINTFFPLPSQIYQIIQTSPGLPVKDVLKTLVGTLQYRTYLRLIDSMVSFTSDGKSLIPTKKFPDELPNHCIVRTPDFIGKFKIYRYSTRLEQMSLPAKANKGKRPAPKRIKASSLESVNKAKFVALGPIPKVSFIGPGKRPAGSTPTSILPATKKRKLKQSTFIDDDDLEEEETEVVTPRRTATKKQKEKTPTIIDELEIDEEETGLVRRPRRAKMKTLKSFAMMDIDDEPDDDEEEFKPSTKQDEDEESDEEFKSPVVQDDESDEEPLKQPSYVEPVDINEMESITPQVETKETRKFTRAPVPNTLKSLKRQSALLDLIKERGGVVCNTIKLVRQLDQKLGFTTKTDMKTCVRDITNLINSKELEVRVIPYRKGAQELTKRLLIVTEEGFRPTEEQIEEVKQGFLQQKHIVVSQAPKYSTRLIEGEVTIYQNEEPQKRLASLRGNKKRRGKSIKKEKPAKVAPPAAEPTATAPAGEPSIKKKATKKAREPIPHKTTPVVVKKKSRKATSVDDGSPMSEDKLPDLVSRRHRRRTQPKSKKEGRKHVPRRYRPAAKLDKSDATTLFRAVCICKCFSRASIDFDSIADLFEGMNGPTIKQRWSIVRRQIGGMPAVNKGIEELEKIVLRAIDEELVSSSDLEDVKLQFFLDLWKDSSSTIIEVEDRMPLYSNVENNLPWYTKLSTGVDTQMVLYDHLEDRSMRQKESVLAGQPFYYDEDLSLQPGPFDNIKTTLKAIFSTPEKDLTPSKVNQILSTFGDEVVRNASSALIKDKQMVYIGSDDSDSRFLLTDRVFNCLGVRTSGTFFNQAETFKENISSIIDANKGLILSQGIVSGEMATLMQLIGSAKINITHIDKAYKFDSYESRQFDKEYLNCDIVAYGNEGFEIKKELAKIQVPVSGACSHIWVDLNGNINESLWIKIIIAMLHYIHYRPGIPPNIIYNKLSATLGSDDFMSVINWLKESKCITEGPYSGYWIMDPWLSILGF